MVEGNGTLSAGLAFASALGFVELAQDFAGDGVVALVLDELLHLRLLVGRHVFLIPLHKHEEGLVPEHGQHSLLLDEADEVVHQSVDHSVRKRILLIEQDANEDTVGAW